jgi:hypothetical protein
LETVAVSTGVRGKVALASLWAGLKARKAVRERGLLRSATPKAGAKSPGR